MRLSDEIEEITKHVQPPERDIDKGEPAVDWRKILKVYIKTVLHQESVTYMSSVSEDDLAPHEHAALLALDAEVKLETPYD